MARRCGWLPKIAAAVGSPVWATRDLIVHECPKSYVSADSAVLLESFSVWKKFGGIPVEQRSAREVEAFLILDGELTKEGRINASQNGANC